MPPGARTSRSQLKSEATLFHNRCRIVKLSRSIREQIELGDFVLALYALAFVRQYFWVIDNDLLAWILSLLVTAVISFFYVSTRGLPAERFGRSFYLVVGLPLLGVYLLHAALPDHSFDVLTYHLLHSERSLHGPLYAPGDFFPSATPFNPVADTILGFGRVVLGFRLGTIINLIVLLWTGQIAEKILRPFVERPWLRAVCVLVALMSEQFFFEISTYMVDLLALPLMLEATLLTLRFDEAKNRGANFARISLLLGAALAFKLTNLAVAFPLLAICAYKMTVGPERFKLRQISTSVAIAAVAFLAPLLPFSIYIFRLTGNPVFPVANGYFKSPYWPTSGGWDNRWGPQTFTEIITWPVLIWFKPDRLSELAVYSGRLSLACIVALGCLVLVWRNERARLLVIVLLSSAILWSAVALGYSRYGLYEELLAGIVVVTITAIISRGESWARPSWRVALASIICIVLLAQAGLACRYTLQKEWGSRSNAIDNPKVHAAEIKLVLRDRDLGSFLAPADRALFDGVQMWLETCPKSTGFEVLLNPRAPVLAARQPEYFATRASWREFIRRIEQPAERKMFSLCLNEDLATAKEVIAQRGLELGAVTPVTVPFFSAADRIGMTLIEIRVPRATAARQEFETAWMKGAFTPSVYREEIVAINPPTALRAGEKAEIRFKVKNLGDATWPAVGTRDFRYQVNMGNRWLIGATRLEDNRAVLNGDLAPGAETQITLTVNAPRTPGDYTLEIDMVHEGVTWFSEKGGRPLQLAVHVTP